MASPRLIYLNQMKAMLWLVVRKILVLNGQNTQDTHYARGDLDVGIGLFVSKYSVYTSKKYNATSVGVLVV